MSKAILIMGESGSGKTTSCRDLPPGETYYIDCDKKGLSWRGWRQAFNIQNKNYKATDDAGKVMELLQGISQKCPKIKYVVVDTLNGIMVGDEMRRIKEKGYDKWVDLASSVWDLVDSAYSYREDLTILFKTSCSAFCSAMWSGNGTAKPAGASSAGAFSRWTMCGRAITRSPRTSP